VTATVSNAPVAADTVYAHPTFIPYQCTIDQIGMTAGTLAVGNGVMGIYTDVSGAPGALVAAGSSSVDLNVASGSSLITGFASNPTLAPGWYWFASLFSAATATPFTFSGNAVLGAGFGQVVGAGSVSGTARAVSSPYSRLTRTASQAYASGLPATFGAAAPGVGAPGAPVVGYRVL
jgi:hypothetical protein